MEIKLTNLKLVRSGVFISEISDVLDRAISEARKCAQDRKLERNDFCLKQEDGVYVKFDVYVSTKYYVPNKRDSLVN